MKDGFLLCSGCRTIYWLHSKYLYNKYWRFYFLTCTTCIVYQYFKELVASVSKAGAKVSGLFLTAKLFSKFFSFFFSIRFSDSLCERERCIEQGKRQAATCEPDCKDKDFYSFIPNFFESFFRNFSEGFRKVFVLITGRVRASYSKSPFQGCPLLESGCKSSRFSVTLQIYTGLFFIYFWMGRVTRWNAGML